MLVKTNTILIKKQEINENLFNPNLLSLKRCEILISSSTSFKLKGTSTDGYHADYVINGSANKMKILTFSCEFQSTTERGNVVVYAGTSQSDSDILYSFDEVNNQGKVNLCIPIIKDYMEIRFGCNSDYTSISEVTFTDVQLSISEKPIQMLNNGILNYEFDWQDPVPSQAIPKGYTEGGEITVSFPEKQIKYTDPSLEMVHVIPDEGKLLEEVWVYPIQVQSKTATPNASKQTVKPDTGKLLSSVVVNAVPTQSKTATPSSSQQVIKPDTGKFLSQVTVNAIPGISLNYQGNMNNVTNFDITLNKNYKDALLVLTAGRDGIGDFFVYAKKVSGTVTLTRFDESKEIYPNSAKFALAVYKITGNTGAILNIFATNTANLTSGNQAAGFIVKIYGY